MQVDMLREEELNLKPKILAFNLKLWMSEASSKKESSMYTDAHLYMGSSNIRHLNHVLKFNHMFNILISCHVHRSLQNSTSNVFRISNHNKM